jgi:hypothetical protein
VVPGRVVPHAEPFLVVVVVVVVINANSSRTGSLNARDDEADSWTVQVAADELAMAVLDRSTRTTHDTRRTRRFSNLCAGEPPQTPDPLRAAYSDAIGTQQFCISIHLRWDECTAFVAA